MNEEFYRDDYDQEYAEGYSAYKYDNEDYESGYEDAPEYAEGEDVDEYMDDRVDDDDCDVYHEESVHERHKETPQTSDIAAHLILLGSIVAALGNAALKKSATKHRQQQARQRPHHVAPQSPYATEWDKKIEGHIMNGCAAIVATDIIIFFVWLFI